MVIASKSEVRTAAPIHPATRMGHVHYTVADLDRQVAFYRDILGFKLHRREGDTAALGAGGEDLLRLTERRGARRVGGTTGLYHTAFLAPTRLELAQLLRRIAETRTPIQGMTDHRTHLAIYLPDAEGNGIELAWDFPREQWPVFEGKLRFDSAALLPEELFAELAREPAPWTGLHPDTRIGHVHLHVADLDSTRQFYHDVLGFDIVFEEARMGALFVSAGGYHHHLAFNLWNGAGAPPPDATGLRDFTVIVPGAAEMERLADRLSQAGIEVEQVEGGILLRDPSHNRVMLIGHAA